MRLTRQNASLGKEPLLQQLHVAVVERERLERVADTQLLVDDLVDGAHAARAERPDYAVDADAVVWLEGCHASIIAHPGVCPISERGNTPHLREWPHVDSYQYNFHKLFCNNFK